MAGESPDKVERRQSSGETTGDGGAVASTPAKKPGKTSGKKSGGKRERKPAEGSQATAARSAEPPAEARDEAGSDASKTPSKSSDRNGRSAEAEAAPDAGDGGADAAETGAESDAEKPAGDTTGDGGGAEGNGRNDARLKAAVAAWVAGSDDEGDETEQSDASAENPEEGDAVKDGAANSGPGEENSSQIPASDLPVRPKSDDGQSERGGEDAESRRDSRAPGGTGASEASGGSESAARTADEVDHATAMFRTVRPGSDDLAAATDSEEAARRAERMTTAFFGAGKKTETEETGEKPGQAEDAAPVAEQAAQPERAERAESAAESAEVAEQAEPGGPGAPGAPDERSEGEDGSEAAAESEPEPEREPEQRSKPEPQPEPESGSEKTGGEQGGKGESTARRVDEPTTAFRTLDPDAASKRSDAKPGTGRVDQPTAVFRTVDPAERDGSTGTDGSDGADETGKAKKDADEDAGAKPAKPVDPRLPAASESASKSGAEAKTSEAKTSESAKPQQEKPEPKRPETERPASQKPEAKAKAKAKPKPEAESESESESERTSQFVPLRSADAPPRPTHAPGPVVPPKPEGKPTAGALPPEAEPPSQLSEAELTRQQVRPDQAPLDLLAQLTNTPPPPETPLRTAVRRVKIWTPLAAVLAILFVIAQAVRPLPAPELSLSAQPTYSFQGPKPTVPWPSEGQAALDVQGLGSFGSSGKQKPVPIASVAKVMTAYVILRDHPVKKGSEGAKIPVDKKAEKEAGLSAQNESTVEVKKGDTLTEKEAVEAVMIASANNVARLLARWDAGSEKAFAKKMNAAAKDLGMEDTKYTDPSGLTASTVSTATDQVKLAKKAMDIDLFRETVRLPGYKDAKGEQHGNWNKLVPLDGVVGIKTGTTTKAGGNLLFAAEKRVGGTEQVIVGAVLGQYEPSILDTVLAESKKLIDTAQDALRAQRVVQKGEVVGYVDDQLGGRTPVVASRDVSAVGWSGLKVKLGLTDGGKALPHVGKAGERAGTLTVGDGPGQVRVPVTLKEDMTEPGFGAKLTRIL